MSSIPVIENTIKIGTIDSAFTEVVHSESLDLRNPAQLRLFHLKLDGVNFTDDGLYKCIRRNIGRYVFSRTRIEKFKSDGDEDSINLEATQQVLSKKNAEPERFGNMLGEILLYAFFEEKLEAPKIFSKMELDSAQPDSAYDGIHLLTVDEEEYQMVFGTSFIDDGIEDAISNAFDKIKKANSTGLKGIPLVREIIFNQAADTELADKLSSIITPDPNAPTVDSAYGIFICHSIGLDKTKYSIKEYRSLLENKMISDIQNSIPQIKQMITNCGLDSHSFYVYVIPLDDATLDKTSIMNKVIGGSL